MSWRRGRGNGRRAAVVGARVLQRRSRYDARSYRRRVHQSQHAVRRARHAHGQPGVSRRGLRERAPPAGLPGQGKRLAQRRSTTRCRISHTVTSLRRLRMYRRGFLGRLAATAAAGVAGLTPLRLEAQPSRQDQVRGADPSFETWLNRINGKHKMIFDAPEPNSGMPVVWPRVWLNGNNENYGTKDADNSAVIVLRHSAIPIAMQDALWVKYKLGEVFNIKDGDAPAVRNVFVKGMPLPLPGTGLEALLASGAHVGCCNVALTVYSGMVAQKMNMDAAAVKAEWVAGLIPGVQVVPSGVLAVARSQEKGCAYCFAG